MSPNVFMKDFKQDSICLREMAKDSVEAFDALYLRYFPLVETFSYAMLKDRNEARDLCQGVFMKLWERRRKLVEVTSLSSYLFIMTRNDIFRIFEEKKKSRDAEPISEDILRGLQIGNLEDEIASRDLLHILNIAVESMPEQRRKVFCMSRKDGKTYVEIAEILGISVKTVEYHISKALSELRDLLKIIVLFF